MLPALAAALVLDAAPAPDGGVKLRWQPIKGAEATLSRSLEPAPGDDVPAARWKLDGRGEFVDAAPADGVTYHYRLALHLGGLTLAEGGVTVATPPRQLPALRRPAIAIDKAAYVLTVLDGDRPVKRYPIALGGAPRKRKLCFDNASTPEGLYTIVGVQPRATFHRAYDLSYPNALDRVRWRVAGVAAPIGGEIQIHGRGVARNWTFGCIALRDADMDELFARPALGVGTPVRIWGGELAEAEVMAMARPPAPDVLRRWSGALVRHGLANDGGWGPSLWEAIGRFQRARGLRQTCQPDGETARALGVE